MPALAGWVLDHKRLVVSFWAAVTIAAFAAIGPAGKSLSQQFGVPGREGFETNRHVAALYGNGGGGCPVGSVCRLPAGGDVHPNGGDVAPIVPVVRLPEGTTVHSRGVKTELAGALTRVKAALPAARIASYA